MNDTEHTSTDYDDDAPPPVPSWDYAGTLPWEQPYDPEDQLFTPGDELPQPDADARRRNPVPSDADELPMGDDTGGWRPDGARRASPPRGCEP